MQVGCLSIWCCCLCFETLCSGLCTRLGRIASVTAGRHNAAHQHLPGEVQDAAADCPAAEADAAPGHLHGTMQAACACPAPVSETRLLALTQGVHFSSVAFWQSRRLKCAEPVGVLSRGRVCSQGLSKGLPCSQSPSPWFLPPFPGHPFHRLRRRG